MTAEGLAVQVACNVLGVSESGFYEHRKRPPSERSIRHAMLTDLITQIHVESHGIYGGRRVHAELTLGCGVVVAHNQVQLLMRRAGLAGITGRRRWKRVLPDNIATDRVERQFSRSGPNQLWVTDITEHPTREGKVYCCVILDTYSRRVVGWSIDSSPTGALVTNALGMAIDSRLDKSVEPGTIIHSDQGVQGGFNWSSQHPEFGGVQRWRPRTGARRPAMRPKGFADSGARIGRCGRRCVRLGGLIPRGWCSGSSGG
ncbi:IS3 family transposase [Nocardioides sp. BSK12Z-4]|uniref:IS3 family transposase n=2 Tax=Nocardioides bruguierae TaxID=2945102 RepID=A0A9X2DBF5_9ACTN|nr:IS3 family transposase [Nocardioides bruguierae]